MTGDLLRRPDQSSRHYRCSSPGFHVQVQQWSLSDFRRSLLPIRWLRIVGRHRPSPLTSSQDISGPDGTTATGSEEGDKFRESRCEKVTIWWILADETRGTNGVRTS